MGNPYDPTCLGPDLKFLDTKYPSLKFFDLKDMGYGMGQKLWMGSGGLVGPDPNPIYDHPYL